MTNILIITTHVYEIRATMWNVLELMERDTWIDPNSVTVDFVRGYIRLTDITIRFRSHYVNKASCLRPDYFVSLDTDIIRYFTSRGSKRLTTYDEVIRVIENVWLKQRQYLTKEAVSEIIKKAMDENKKCQDCEFMNMCFFACDCLANDYKCYLKRREENDTV